MTIDIRVGDALTELRKLEAESVHCCVTSPPYWGLRDYGTARWDGGDPACGHKGSPKPRQDTTGAGVENGRFASTRGGQPSKSAYVINKAHCVCGAVRIDAQLGLETTPEEYIAKMVEVFEQVRRVLRSDGTLWLNIGDCYATGAGAVGDHPDGGKQGARWRGEGSKHQRKGSNRAQRGDGNDGHSFGPMTQPNRMPIPGLKQKDLVGIPWMLAFALRAAGWWLRSDIIWHKPNPMPESTKDRPTKAHEYLFLLTKSARYYYDGSAIAESAASAGDMSWPKNWGIGDQPRSSVEFSAKVGRSGNKARKSAHSRGVPWEGLKRNKRSVWTVATAPYSDAHFATFPPALIEPCILAGSARGGAVLDPFAGAGTTGLVAHRLDRLFIGIELNPKYAAMARRRIRDDAPLFHDPEAA